MKFRKWLAASLFAFASAGAMAQSIVLASTTSTEQSGLFGHLLPEFTKATGACSTSTARWWSARRSSRT